MKKFFVVFLFVVLGTFSWSQDVNANFFSFNEKEDTVQATCGIRFGSITLSQPPTHQNLSAFQKKSLEDFPNRIGVGNFIIDMRVRFSRDTISHSAHDGMLGMNFSLLRSRVYLGYQFNRARWYTSFRVGYEVYRMPKGEIRWHTKLFSQNVPMIGFECGYLPKLWDQTFRIRALGEYDFNRLGWYGSGIVTGKLYGDNTNTKRVEIGTQFDGIFGYGWFGSVLWGDNLFYVSTFQGQFSFQETRFPEQRIGMGRGFAFGFQRSFK